jgi:hypothetical protein
VSSPKVGFIWMIARDANSFRGVAQLVARTAGGREAAGSSPVTPTTQDFVGFEVRFEWLSHLVINHFFAVYTHVQVD